MRLRLLFGTILAAAAIALHAQEDTFYRLELGGGLGMGFSLDDVNSRFFGSSDLTVGAVARFPLNPRMAVKTRLAYLGMSGETAQDGDFYPTNPSQAGPERLQYKLSGGLVDLTGLFELHFLPYGWVQGYQGYKRLTPYVQAGIGFTYATPGKAFCANIPIGVGVKWKIRERLNLSLDWTFHFTASDKLDGLEAPHGIKSSEFRNKDHYSLTLLSLTYDLSPRCPTCNKD